MILSNFNDDTLSRRLRQLDRMPIDTHKLDRALFWIIESVRVAHRWKRIRNVATFAASLIVLATVASALLLNQPAYASPSALAEIHSQAGQQFSHMLSVNSIDEANLALSALRKDLSQLPSVPQMTGMSCCAHTLGRRNLTCAMMDFQGQRVTLLVGKASDFKSPTGQVIEIQRRKFTIATQGSLTMIMGEIDGRWVCLVSDASQSDLLRVAGQITFSDTSSYLK